MTVALPFAVHRLPTDLVAWHAGRPVTRARLVADARRLAQQLPASASMLNACNNRYYFTVGFLAAMMRGQLSVLPNNLVAQTLVELRGRFADLYCLTDQPAPMGELPCIDCAAVLSPSPQPTDASDDTMPAFAPSQVAACLFTSGSTGAPVAHHRSWGSIVASGRAQAQRMGIDASHRFAILGTVPPQHSYGLESTVFLALQGGGALVAERPFFPADVVQALVALPPPRLLVTTPVHLRALLGLGGIATGQRLELLLAATAPLPVQLAGDAEAMFNAPLLEIYGSTESGQVASRQPTLATTWHTLPGVQLQRRQDQVIASGGHVETATPLADHIELIDAEHFELLGRTSDMVNIGGKRSSIAFLDRQLLAIDGVVDGAFYVADDGPQDAAAGAPAGSGGSVEADARVGAFVVAPGCTLAQLRRALRERIDPVFLPRPFHLVQALPRNETGKLPRARLLAMARQLPDASASTKPANPTGQS